MRAQRMKNTAASHCEDVGKGYIPTEHCAEVPIRSADPTFLPPSQTELAHPETSPRFGRPADSTVSALSLLRRLGYLPLGRHISTRRDDPWRSPRTRKAAAA